MPKVELKVIQTELDQGLLRPFYWIWGPELLKGRELLKRIRTVTRANWGEETLDGVEVDGQTICDSARSLFLGGGIRLVVVRDAQMIKSPEPMAVLFGPALPRDQVSSVCVCLAKDFDSRKKFSKLLLDGAAVIGCETVSEDQREAWVHYLAKRQGVQLSPQAVSRLVCLDPWTLDLIAQELDKWAVAGSQSETVLGQASEAWSSDQWVDHFFARQRGITLAHVNHLAENLDQALPLLGLLSWNAKQLAQYLSASEGGGQSLKTYPAQLNRLKRWSQIWSLTDVIALQHELFHLDLSFKQTPLMPLGLWSTLVCRFCR